MSKKLSVGFKVAGIALLALCNEAQARDQRFVEISVTGTMPIVSNFALAARVFLTANMDRCLSDFASKGPAGSMPRDAEGVPEPVEHAGFGDLLLCDHSDNPGARHVFLMPEKQPWYVVYTAGGKPSEINGALSIEIPDDSGLPVAVFAGAWATFGDDGNMQIKCIGAGKCSLTAGEQADLFDIMKNVRSWAHDPRILSAAAKTALAMTPSGH